jgi:hypothetical protein
MTSLKLTSCQAPSHKESMNNAKRGLAGAMLIMGAGLLPGCISLQAPDKPIVIELNINITQEVIYRLAADAGNTIDENADIF